MLSVSISAMPGCACSPSRIYLWDRKFRLNFFLPEARNGFVFAEWFAIALSICTESSFYRIRTNAKTLQEMSAQFQAARTSGPVKSPIEPSNHRLLLENRRRRWAD